MKLAKLDFPVMSSWIENNGQRLDSNPYLSGSAEAKSILENLSVPKIPLHHCTLEGRKGIIHPGRLHRTWVVDPAYGIPFLSSTDILQADLNNLSLISKKVVKPNSRFLLQEGWTLISRSGTIGRMAYCRSDLAGMACTEDVLRVVPDPKKIPPGYLYAYLSSSFGVSLIVSGTYGAIIPHIEPHHLVSLPVPRLGKKIEDKAHNKITKAAKLRTQYQVQVRKATTKLFNSVGLSDITASQWHSMEADLGFSQTINSSASLRALNFNPRLKILGDTIRANGYQELQDICQPGTLHRSNRHKRIEAQPGFGCELVGQRQFCWLRPKGRWVAKFGVKDDAFVEPGTILVAAQGTLGESELYCRSEFIWGPAVEMAYSEHLLRVIADEKIMPRGCLFAFMRSETAFRMLRSSSMGSKQQDHHPTFLKHLPVPYPDREIQREIHELVVDAYEKRHRSNVLEDEAIDLVEQAIAKESNN